MKDFSNLVAFSEYPNFIRLDSILGWMYNVHLRVRWVIIAIKLIFSRLPVAWILRSWSNNNRELNLIDQLMTQEVLGNGTSWPSHLAKHQGFILGFIQSGTPKYVYKIGSKAYLKLRKRRMVIIQVHLENYEIFGISIMYIFKFILKILRFLGFSRNILFRRHCSFIS